MNIDKAIAQAKGAHDASQVLTDAIANYLHSLQVNRVTEADVQTLYHALNVTQSHLQRSTHSYVAAAMQRGRRAA